MTYWKHERAEVATGAVGEGTRIEADASVGSDVTVGRRCRIGRAARLDGAIRLEDEVTVGDGAGLSGDVTVSRGAWIGAHCSLSGANSPAGLRTEPRIVIGAGAWIGANASVLAGVTVGAEAAVESGSVITRDVPPKAIVAGNPGQIVGYRGIAADAVPRSAAPSPASVQTTSIPGVTLHRMPVFEDLRGLLSFGEGGRTIPFEVKRYFLVYGVPSQEIRGEHAHRTLHQFLICVMGRCHIVADDGSSREEFVLDSPAVGLHIPPMVWGVQYRYTPDAILLALTSGYYDPGDYIRDYDEFLRIRRS